MIVMDSTLLRARPTSPDAWGRGVTLAVLVHAVLIVALAFGVNWRSHEPAGIEAELWAAVPQVAAPRVETPPPKLEPVVKPKVEPPPKEAEPPRANEAEIAIEKARREKLLREQLQEQERREREEAQKRRQAEEQKRKAEQQSAAEREAQRKQEEQERRDEQRLAKLREDNLTKMMAQAGSGTANSTGTAARSAGPSAGYAGRIVARVKPNIVFGDELAGNPSALVEVRAAPDGTIIGRRLVKSSGVKAWDEAVLRAIDRTEVLPRDADGRVPTPIEIAFQPKE